MEGKKTGWGGGIKREETAKRGGMGRREVEKPQQQMRTWKGCRNAGLSVVHKLSSVGEKEKTHLSSACINRPVTVALTKIC